MVGDAIVHCQLQLAATFTDVPYIALAVIAAACTHLKHMHWQ